MLIPMFGGVGIDRHSTNRITRADLTGTNRVPREPAILVMMSWISRTSSRAGFPSGKERRVFRIFCHRRRRSPYARRLILKDIP